MKSQDLTVLVNLAERARQAGLIKFEEFAVVAEAVKNAAIQLNAFAAAEQSSTETSVEPTTKKTAKTAKIND